MFVTDWWHFVYTDLMGENVLMMLLFGWELFITPIVFALTIAGVLVQGLVTVVTDRH